MAESQASTNLSGEFVQKPACQNACSKRKGGNFDEDVRMCTFSHKRHVTEASPSYIYLQSLIQGHEGLSQALVF